MYAAVTLPVGQAYGRPAKPGRNNATHVVNVATPVKPPTSYTAKRSKVEIYKETSDFLRHPLMEELVNGTTSISEQSYQLLKFHGSYQQDHREKRAFGEGKFYQFMLRTKQPAGQTPPELYLVLDDLATKYGNNTLRLTTRQTFQMHGILKDDLKTVFSTIIKNLGSTLGACGDLNRNVTATPAPFKTKPEYQYVVPYSNDIADLLAPQSGAYYDVWLDGEKFVSAVKENPKVTDDRLFNKFGTNYEGSAEPIYGHQFLPRKFKIGVTVPGDNSIDIFTNDIGVIIICNDAGELEGFNILVGGGMGRTRGNDDTFPRLADPIGFVSKDDIFHCMKAIVATQRDYGRRDDRKFSRMKYLIHDWGIDKFRTVVEQYMGKKFQPFRPIPDWEFLDFLGWHEQGDGKEFYGLFIQNGRLKGQVKATLRQIVEKYQIPTVITANQNLLLCDIEPAWKADIELQLQSAGLSDMAELDSIERLSMACPALPLCGLAVGEAERGLPDVNRRLRALLTKLGLADEELVVRMTGCPNGCARPYMAELGFVGDGPNSYQLWLGGSPNQTRLAESFMDRVRLPDLEATLEPIFYFWQQKRKPAEAFGDFCARVGFEEIKQYIAAYVPVAANGSLKHVSVTEDLFDALKEKAVKQGKSVSHIASEAINTFLKV